MKSIQLNGVRPPVDPASAMLQHHLYSVHLGNRITVMFTSERAALAFQAETDRWLSAHLVDCNFLLVDAFSSYRAAWCLFDMVPKALATIEHRTRECVQTAWTGMDMAITKGKGPNGWVLAWNHLFAAVDAVRTLALMLRDLFRSRNHPVDRARMEHLVKRCDLVLNEMRHWGDDVKGAVSTRKL